MSIEDGFDQQFGVPVCGIDEVGRGPLAGPVVSACVLIMPENLSNPLWQEITDSKKISAIKREKLFEPIKELCFYGIAEANVTEIDRMNIHHATLLAMKRAFEKMVVMALALLPPLAPPQAGGDYLPLRGNSTITSPRVRGDKGGSDLIALIDGKFAPEIDCRTQTVIKGDSLSLSIGAASIIAKVTRDRLMTKLHAEFPHYGWNSNAGYGTKAHMAGLESHGLTPHHRLSFAPCAARQKKA